MAVQVPKRIQGIQININLVKLNTVNREIFVVKIFSDSMASPKIKRTKIMHIINDNAVRGRLSKNYLTRKFIARNICDAKYSRFTVVEILKVVICHTVEVSPKAGENLLFYFHGKMCV